MNTLYFKYAVEVERAGSISQAAENLFMAQPNLSKAVRELEDSLGIVIFQRTSKGMTPTEQGREFLGYAKRVLMELAKMESISAGANDKAQCFRVSVPRAGYIAQAVTGLISELDSSEDIDVRSQETNSMQTIRNVEENSCDLGIVRYQTAHRKYFDDYIRSKGLETETLWEYEKLALMSRRHYMANAETLSYSVLAETSIEVLYGDNMIPYIQDDEAGKPAAQDERKHRRVYVYERASRLLMLKHTPEAFTMASPATKEILQMYELVQRRCQYEGNRWRDVLVFRAGHRLTGIEKMFLSRYYEVKNDAVFKDYI